MLDPIDREKCLELLLLNVDSPTEVRLEILTQPELLKSDEAPPYPGMPSRLRKRSRLRGLVCMSYTDAVNAQRRSEGKEPSFVASPRKGPERIGFSPLLRGKDGLLLECLVREVESVQYEIEGEPVSAYLIEPWLKQSSSPTSHQGVDRPVIYRTIKLANVVDLEFPGLAASSAPVPALQPGA